MESSSLPQTAPLLSAIHAEAELLLNLSTAAAIVFDLSGKIYIASESAAELLQFPSAAALVGKNVLDLLNLDGMPLEARVVQMSKSRREESFEDRSGERMFACALSPAFDKKNNIQFVLLTIKNISAGRQVNERLRFLIQSIEDKVLERAAMLQEEKNRAEILAALSQTMIAYAHDYWGLLNHVAGQITSLIADFCMIALALHDDEETLHVAALSHSNAELREKMWLKMQDYSFSIHEQKLTALLRDQENGVEKQWTYEEVREFLPDRFHELISPGGWRGVAAIPLSLRDKQIGIIFVIRNRNGAASFNRSDFAFLKSLASPLALTIENARMFNSINENRSQLRHLAQQLVDLQENQYRQLARELHDSVGQNMTAININLSLLEKTLPQDYPENIKTLIGDTSKMMEDTIARMRNIMAEFLPPMLERYGLSAALIWFGQQFTSRTQVAVQVNDYSLRALRLPPQTEIGLFRIAQEAFNNISKYARASQVEVELKDDGEYVQMTIADNGVGFDMQKAANDQTAHWGLMIMRERARALDASFKIESAPGRGTKIQVRVARL